MVLRGWRLFGVAGTIFAYVAGILLLSILSLNSPNQRRPRSGRFGEFESFRHREINLMTKRQPLQWCQNLRFLDVGPKDIYTTKLPKLMQTFPKHYVKAPKQYYHYSVKKLDVKFDDRYIDNKETEKKSKRINDEFKITYEKIWPKQMSNQKLMKKREEDNKLNEPRNLIALASFPGSGNTWLRYLLQQATGIYTGSVYKDFGLFKSGFPAENVFNSSVLVVKTHEWGPNKWVYFSKAILLVRDPDKAIIAEFNRQSGGHVGFASPDRYKRNKGRYWNQFVTNKLLEWELVNLQWAFNFTGEITIIYYDDIVDDVEGTLRKILQFINFPINEPLLACALSRKEGIYRRKKRIMTFDPYTPDMHKALEEKKRKIYTELGRYKF